MNRPDGPHNAPPIAPPSQGARAPAARPGGPPNAPAGQGERFAPPRAAPERQHQSDDVEVSRNDVEALRARAATAIERQRPANTPSSGDAPDPGTVLASIARPDGTQLRVSAHTYEGRPFVRVAPWSSRDGGSTWWPVKGKGASVKVRELAAVAAALLDALDVVGNDGPSKPQREVR
jgi:hypothetical protein